MIDWIGLGVIAALLLSLSALVLAVVGIAKQGNIEKQISSVQRGTELILSQQEPLLTLATQLTGALVTVTERRPTRPGRVKPTTQVKIETLSGGGDVTIGGNTDKRQRGGVQMQGPATIDGSVAGRNVTEEKGENR